LPVLNLLNERPMHPYEMRSLMRERGHDRAFRIRESSVYDTVARLADRGFIEPVEVNREGRRPERTVYAITEAGRDELLVWLTELTSEPDAEYPAFAAPLMFICALGRDGAVTALPWSGSGRCCQTTATRQNGLISVSATH
jgi:DNA-binding PadR family transcriptional regulator